MQSLVKKLKQICTQFPFKEKIVIVDSYAFGEQINEAYIKDGHQAINLKYKTVSALAMDIIELNTEQAFNKLETSVGIHFTYSLLKDLKNQDKLRYFYGMEITPSFSTSIFSTIQSLRSAGFTARTINREAFINKEKAEDLVEILSQFEDLLHKNQYLDQAAILLEAIELAERDEEKLYILQSNLDLSFLEESLLTKILPAGSNKLPLAPVYGISLPERTSLSSISTGDSTPLSYLYQPEDGDFGAADLHIFTSKAEELEVKHIFEELLSVKERLDNSIVYYTAADSYITLFYHLSQKLDIPITFGEGLPVSFSRPGRFVSGLIAWIQSNYSVSTFIDLLNEGLLELGEDAPSKSKIARLLRDLQVGWSQDRYLSGLKTEREALAAKGSAFDKRVKEIGWLQHWFSTIFKYLPPFAQNMNYKKCLTGMAFLLKNNCKTNSALDEIAKTSVLEEIAKIVPYADEELSMYEVVEKVKDLLLSLKVNQSRPKPGHLHVSSYKNGIFNSRTNVFFVGLDNRKFPGNSSEDPLLLDRERMILGNHLPLLREKGRENLYTLLLAIAQTSGKVTVSYCHFNINDNRAVNPAHVILQCYRFVTGNQTADFKELQSLSVKLSANDIFEEKDFWNEKLIEDRPYKVTEEILQNFQNIKHGLAAEKARFTVKNSEFDGLVKIDAALYDPRLNQEKRMSAGKLEMLARCPYSYFLKEILRVKPIEEVSFDANKWLDPATRGSLLHSIFETFYKELKQEKVKPAYAIHHEKIIAIALRLIEQEKEITPPPNDRVYQRELKDILACCAIFLKEEEQHSENYDAQHFEYAFGIGESEPAIITLPSGEVKISGIIDRVDQSPDGRYHIIDYKTGSTYGYGKNELFKGGRQLQHMIYALAIEQHLQLGEGAVEESSYYFPTVKGMAQRFTRKQDDTLRTNGLDILEKLIDVIKHGHFEMTDDVNDCKFCELKLVCRRHFYDKDTLLLKQSNQRLKGVRAYD